MTREQMKQMLLSQPSGEIAPGRFQFKQPLRFDFPTAQAKEQFMQRIRGGQAMPTKTAAFALGATNGYFSHIMPPDRVFQKIASKTGFNKEMVKQAYLHKKAINWKALLTAGGLGLGGAMAIPALYRWATRAPAIGEEVQRDPAMDQVGRMAARNLQNSTYLQGIRGAFAPAESPWGKTGSLSKTSSEKISGF